MYNNIWLACQLEWAAPDEVRKTMRDLFIVIVLLIENCLVYNRRGIPTWVTFQVLLSLSLCHSHLSAWPIFVPLAGRAGSKLTVISPHIDIDFHVVGIRMTVAGRLYGQFVNDMDMDKEEEAAE